MHGQEIQVGEFQAAGKWVPVKKANRCEEQSRLCVSVAESRRLKLVAPLGQSVPLADRAAGGADVVDVPADAIVSAVPWPHWWLQTEKDEKSKVIMLALGTEAEEFKTNNFNIRCPIAAKSFQGGVLLPGYSFRMESQAFMKETMDVQWSEEKWPPGSLPRLCAQDVDIEHAVRSTSICWQACRLREPLRDRS